MNKVVLMICMFTVFTFFPKVLAAEAALQGKVIRVLTTSEDQFGGCMVMLNASVSGAGLNCPANNWVTFSCSGDFASKEDALRNYDAALMAKALSNTVFLKVTDSKKHNGFCFASRIDIM